MSVNVSYQSLRELDDLSINDLNTKQHHCYEIHS